jgi:hypothetical protein
MSHYSRNKDLFSGNIGRIDLYIVVRQGFAYLYIRVLAGKKSVKPLANSP